MEAQLDALGDCDAASVHGERGVAGIETTWTQISPYCLRWGDFTIVKVGSSRGWRYELWLKKNQLVVDLSSAQHAMDERRKVITGI
jgi:hypothetical protein